MCYRDQGKTFCGSFLAQILVKDEERLKGRKVNLVGCERGEAHALRRVRTGALLAAFGSIKNFGLALHLLKSSQVARSQSFPRPPAPRKNILAQTVP